MFDDPILVADIGGTNARFALVESGAAMYQQEQVLRCEDYPAAEDGIRAYLNSVGVSRISAMSLAIAGPVRDGKVQATNSHWEFCSRSLCKPFGLRKVLLLNDFEAIACSLPLLAANDLRLIGGDSLPDLSVDDFAVAVVGPGTGLGVAGLIGCRENLTTLVTEAGHVGFAPESEEQRHVLERLAEKYGRVSDERLVSGPGVENIYWAFTDSGSKPEDESVTIRASEIFSRAAAGSDPLATKAVNLFFEILGQVAGNAALSQGAYDGLYLAGGLAQRYTDLLPTSRFREGFENKGRYSELMRGIPVVSITHPYPGLLGATAAAIR